MKKFILFFILILPLSAYCQEKITVTLFYTPNCKVCLKLKEEILPPLKEKYKQKVKWRQIDTLESPAGLTELISLSKQFKRQNARTPSVFIDDTFLVGLSEITSGLEPAIKRALNKKTKPIILTKVDVVEIFKKMSLPLVLVSGLIDGINPCAFAVIVFFVSFLAAYGYQRREIAYIGSAYCLAVYISYLLIGLGLFKFLYYISHIYILIKVFYYFVASLCFLMFLLALRDYFRFKKTQSPEGAILQLPKFLKKKINITIGSRLRQREQRSPLSLIFTAFFVGVLVSILEAVCTGQIYVPVIVSILKYSHLRVRALAYFLIYNLMFILPLIIIFLLSLLGVSSERFNRFLKSNLGKIKILMALLFLFLGIFVLGYEAIYGEHISFLLRNLANRLLN